MRYRYGSDHYSKCCLRTGFQHENVNGGVPLPFIYHLIHAAIPCHAASHS